MFRILFICTDNIGRSLTAEYLLRDWLRKNGRQDIEVCSAGINAASDISSLTHRRTQLTKDILDAADLAIAMDETQKAWIKEKFGETVPLYNEIYKNESVSVLISPPGSTGTMEERCHRMVEYFEKSMPKIVDSINSMKSDGNPLRVSQALRRSR